MNTGRFSLFAAIVFGFILFMGTGETSADSVPESEVDFAAQVKACWTPWVNDDADWSDCAKNRYSDYGNESMEFVYSNFITGYEIYFEGNISDDDGNLVMFEWKFESLEWYQGREIEHPVNYYETCDYEVDGDNQSEYRAYCTRELSYGPWNISLRAKDDDGYWGSWSEPYFVYVSSDISIEEIDSNESQIDEGESIEFESLMRSHYDYSYYDGTDCCYYNYSKFVYYVWWSDRDGEIASGNISSDDLRYGYNDDYNHTDDTRCCNQYFESIVEVDDLSAGGHEISFWVMNEYGGWTQYCEWNGCPLQISVVANGDDNNTRPEAWIDSISPGEAEYGERVYFNASGQDEDGYIVNWQWYSNRDGYISYNQDFSTDDLSVGNHTISLRAQDNDDAWSYWDSSNVNVFDDNETEPNISPEAWINNISQYGERVYFNGSGQDDDGYIVNYQWYSDIDGFLSSSSDFSTDNLSVGHHRISFRAQDNDNNWSYWDYSNINVYDNVSRPDSWIVSIVPNPAFYGDMVNFEGDAQDDGYIQSWQWYSNRDGTLSNEQSFSRHNLSIGWHQIQFRAMDEDGFWSDWDYASLDIQNQQPQAWIVDITPNPVQYNDLVFFNGDAFDNDGYIVEWVWNSSIDGFLSWNASFEEDNLSEGLHHISFVVRDDKGMWSEKVYFDLEVFVPPPNYPPIVDYITLFPPESTEKGMSVEFQGQWFDDNNAVVEYEWYSSIDGLLSIDPSFISHELSLGTHEISLRVMDSEGLWSNYTYTNHEVFVIPMADAGEDIEVLPYLPIQFSGVGITDEDDVIVKYEWDFDGDGIFEWSSTETGLATYVYNQDGVYHTEFRVTNSAGHTGVDQRIVTVRGAEEVEQIIEETDSGFLPSLSVTSVIFLFGLISLIRSKRR